MQKRRISAWEIVFYLSLLSILLWLILKLTGVISSPPFLEYGYPIFSGLLAFFALYQGINNRITRIGYDLTKAISKIEYLEKRQDLADIRLVKTDERMRLLEKSG